jgi:polyferredoxin
LVLILVINMISILIIYLIFIRLLNVQLYFFIIIDKIIIKRRMIVLNMSKVKVIIRLNRLKLISLILKFLLLFFGFIEFFIYNSIKII